MFGGTISVSEGGRIEVKTSNGLSPLAVDLGTIDVKNDNSGSQTIKGLAVGKDATVNLDFQDAEINEQSVIRGTLRVGQNATFEGDLKVDGGTLELLENVSDLHLTNVEFGSVLNTMNSKIATISVNQWTMGNHIDLVEGGDVIDNNDGTMQWLLDFDVDKETCDKLEIGTFVNANDTPITIAGYNVLGNAEKDEYWFQILDITNGTYPRIQIPNPLYESTNGNIYKLYANNRDGKVLMSRHPVEVSEIYLPTYLMHTATLSSLSNVFELVYDSRDGLWNSSIIKRKYRIWNKSVTYKYNFNVVGSANDVNARGSATVFGVDAKPIILNGCCRFVASAFAGCLRENNRYSINSNNCCTIGGMKWSWISKNYGSANLICSYAAVRNGNPDCVIRSHVISLSSRYINNLPLAKKVSLVPMTQLDFSHIISGNAKVKNIHITQENNSSLRASIGTNLQFQNDKFKASFGAKFNKKFGKEGNKSFNNINIYSPHKISDSYMEYNAQISGKINNNVNIDLTVGKSFGGRNGISANLTVSATL
jgi:hypothetical protein